ncbi:MAG: hypothetical protein WBK10_01765 [Bacillota bacterium]|jgi:uncharacterized membrane protein|nr:hypothetical protein [Bacillota bacterium]
MKFRRDRTYDRIVGRSRPRRRISLRPWALVVLLLLAAGAGLVAGTFLAARFPNLLEGRGPGGSDVSKSTGRTNPTAPADRADRADRVDDTDVADTTDSADPNDPWEAARQRGVDFRGIGQEPGWVVEIVRGESIYFLFDYGQSSITAKVATDQPSARAGATVYQADSPTYQLSVAIEDRPCTDIMSGHEFPNAVTVTFDGKVFHGCGRPLR